MAKIICIANRKGGVGKTTTANALAFGLTSRGKRVLSIDIDGQGNFSSIIDADTDGLTVYDVLTGNTSAADAIQHTEHGGDLIPSAAALELADVKIPSDAFTRLKESIDPLRPNYDFIIIDTPPSAGILTLNALVAADMLIIPAKADITSADGLDQIRVLVDEIQADNPNLKIAGILLTCFNARSAVRRVVSEILTETAAKMKTHVFKTPIREGVAVLEAQLTRRSLFSKKNNVAADYSAWIDELLEEIE